MKWFLGLLLLLFAALVLESGLLAFATYTLLGLMLISRVLARNWIENLRARRTVAGGGGGVCLGALLVAGDGIDQSRRARDRGGRNQVDHRIAQREHEDGELSGGAITEGSVQLQLSGDAIDRLDEYDEPPPSEELRP